LKCRDCGLPLKPVRARYERTSEDGRVFSTETPALSCVSGHFALRGRDAEDLGRAWSRFLGSTATADRATAEPRFVPIR